MGTLERAQFTRAGRQSRVNFDCLGLIQLSHASHQKLSTSSRSRFGHYPADTRIDRHQERALVACTSSHSGRHFADLIAWSKEHCSGIVCSFPL